MSFKIGSSLPTKPLGFPQLLVSLGGLYMLPTIKLFFKLSCLISRKRPSQISELLTWALIVASDELST